MYSVEKHPPRQNMFLNSTLVHVSDLRPRQGGYDVLRAWASRRITSLPPPRAKFINPTSRGSPLATAVSLPLSLRLHTRRIFAASKNTPLNTVTRASNRSHIASREYTARALGAIYARTHLFGLFHSRPRYLCAPRAHKYN